MVQAKIRGLGAEWAEFRRQTLVISLPGFIFRGCARRLKSGRWWWMLWAGESRLLSYARVVLPRTGVNLNWSRSVFFFFRRDFINNESRYFRPPKDGLTRWACPGRIT